ncbi:MAG: sigma-70 family RNA polymerase sigma factor [Pseudomonadota bacterium]
MRHGRDRHGRPDHGRASAAVARRVRVGWIAHPPPDSAARRGAGPGRMKGSRVEGGHAERRGQESGEAGRHREEQETARVQPPASREEGAALMAAIARGERRALAQIIALYGDGLGTVAARYLGNAAEAEEVVQDTFVRAWRHAARYDPARGAASTWLYRIAVNLCIDRQRRRALRRFVGLEDVEAELGDPAPGAERHAAGRARLAEVRDAMEVLPARQRLALLLRAVAGLDTAEIAETMGASIGSVEQLLVRARRRLTAELAAREADGARAGREETGR